MMFQKGTFGYAAHAQLLAHVVELPYGNEDRLSMYILLPRKGISLSYMTAVGVSKTFSTA